VSLLTLALFLPACFALNMVPGPNNLLAMSNAQRFGFKAAFVAGFGRLGAFLVMIFLAAMGLATILFASKTLFLLVKIVGAGYLFWVAYQLWHSNVADVSKQPAVNKTLAQLAKQEFLLAAGNPKAILIFTAFLPQFIDASQGSAFQFLILGSIFLSLELLAVAIYAGFGAYLGHWLKKGNVRRLFNRGCAAFIGVIGLSLLTEPQR